MSTNPNHLGLGAITKMVGFSKSNVISAAKLGVGATLAIVGTDLLQSRVLVKDGTPLIPPGWSPAFSAGASFILGHVVGAKLDTELGDGMIAGGVGIAVSALVARFTSPAVAASEKAAAAVEEGDAAAQQVAGFGFGRAFSRSLGAMAGLASGQQRSAAVYGVGTPDMSAMGMFAGANVAIEEPGRSALAGANVAIEEPNFAGTFTG